MSGLYVFKRILLFLINPQPANIREWKENLCLLHISTEWTKLIICDVCKYAYIEANPDSANKNVFLESNLEVIRDRKMEDHVQILIIDSASQPGCVLNQTTKLLHQVGIYFARVQYLRFVNFKLVNDHSSCHSYHGIWDNTTAETVSSCYKTYFRNANILDFSDSFQGVLTGSHDVHMLEVCQNFVTAYLSQLKSINGAFLIGEPSFNEFPYDIFYLSLRMDTHFERQFPLTLPVSLRHLCLEHISPRFKWSSFVYYNRSAVFENLVILKLLYSTRKTWASVVYKTIFDGRLERSEEYVITEFPKLEYLEMLNPPIRCHVFFTKRFPRLKTLKLNCMAPSVFPLNKAYIGNLETLEIDLQSVGYYSNDTEDMEAWLKDNFRSKNPIYQTLNLLLEKIKPQSSSKLRIEDDNEGFVLDSSRINWIYLKHLDLCCPIGFVSLLELLKKYVYLEYLSVECIDLGEPNEIGTDVSELSAPLNSTLSTLCLPFTCAVDDFPFLLVVGLVLRLVGLKVLRVPHNVYDDIVSAVKVYQGSYAHLSKLVIKSVD